MTAGEKGKMEEERCRGEETSLRLGRDAIPWAWVEGPWRPRLFDLTRTDAGERRQRILFNDDLMISTWSLGADDATSVVAYSNADGDSVYACRRGRGILLTEAGLYRYEPGDLFYLPRCYAHAFLAEADSHFVVMESCEALAVDAAAGTESPDLAALQGFIGQRRMHCEELEVKYGAEITRVGLRGCLFHVQRVEGSLLPGKIPVHASARGILFRAPRVAFGRLDPWGTNPASVHDVSLSGDRAMVHLAPGLLSLHPPGLPRRLPPPPSQIKGMTFPHEYAVMVDAIRPLQRDPSVEGIELPEFWRSWQL